MMLALIYGMMFNANTVIRCSAPPENMLAIPRMPPAWLRIHSLMTAASTPGTGI